MTEVTPSDDDNEARLLSDFAIPAGTLTSVSIVETPWFPFNITLPPDCTITLHADGRWQGSLALVRERLTSGKGWNDGNTAILLWLLLREMERDARQW